MKNWIYIRLTNQNECVTNVAQLYIHKWMVWYVKRLNSGIHCIDCMWLDYMPTLHAKRGLLSTTTYRIGFCIYSKVLYNVELEIYTSKYTWNSPTRNHQYNNNIWELYKMRHTIFLHVYFILLLVIQVIAIRTIYKAANLNEMKRKKTKIGYLLVFRLVNTHQFHYNI